MERDDGSVQLPVAAARCVDLGFGGSGFRVIGPAAGGCHPVHLREGMPDRWSMDWRICPRHFTLIMRDDSTAQRIRRRGLIAESSVDHGPGFAMLNRDVKCLRDIMAKNGTG